MKIDSCYNIDKALQLRKSDSKTRHHLQLQLLQKHIANAMTIPFYRDLYGKLGVGPESVNHLDMLSYLPFTGRGDIDSQPTSFGKRDELSFRDIALTSGTTGEPVVVPYTEKDLLRLAFNEAMAFYSAGVRQGDRVLLTVTLDRCFVAGLAYYSGVTSLGATAVRSGPGQAARQWFLIEKLRPRVILGVPSFLLELGRWGRENGYDVAGGSIAVIITIGEPIRRADFTLTDHGRQLEEIWGARVHVSYGATEFETAFGECSAGVGGHVHPELMVVEIVDDNGHVLPEGQAGEVVVTPLGVEGFPLVRFKTGDIARLHVGTCPCGWTTPRLGPIEGRLAQRLKCKGTTLYPDTVFHALQDCVEVDGVYLEVRSTMEGSDDLTVVVGCDDNALDPGIIEERLQALLRVRPEVVVRGSAEVRAVMQGDGGRKLKKFFDLRVGT